MSNPVPIRLEQVRLPGELDRSQLVRRIDANRLQVEPSSRWAAPLEGMTRRVLSANLALRLPAGTVADPYQAAPDARPLGVDIQELYGNSQCDVSLSATWVLSAETHGMRAARGMQPGAEGGTEEVHVAAAPGSPCPEILAATMSQAFGVLADRMAAAIVGVRATEGR